MLKDNDCKCKGAELQVISKSPTKPLGSEVKEALIKAGYKARQIPSLSDYEVI